MYKVKKSDLIGDLKGFPIEVVQKMLEKQLAQGNKQNIEIFQIYIFAGEKGFFWEQTEEGIDFWIEVISCNNFDLFFQKYPKHTK